MFLLTQLYYYDIIKIMSRKDITPTILKNLYYKKLLSRKDIALLLKSNPSTIYKKMRKFNMPPRKQNLAVKIAMKNKIIKISKKKLKFLYLTKKLSIPEVAKKLNNDMSIISREIERNNIPRRSQGEAVSLGYRKKQIKKSVIKNLYYQNKFTQKEIAEKLKKSRNYICLLMKKYKLKTRTAEKYHTRYTKHNFSNNLAEKSYLIGFRLGDLHAYLLPSKNLIRIDCTSTKKEQINLFRKLFKKYGNIWIGNPRKDGNMVFVVLLNRSFDFLLPKEDCIPKWVQQNKNNFLSFLAGYTDAEGCIGIGKNNVAFLKISSYDKKILKQIHKNLSKLKIKCNPPRIHIKAGYKKGDGCIYRKDEWSFNMNKKISLLLLLNLLEKKMKHQKRLNDLKLAQRNIVRRT